MLLILFISSLISIPTTYCDGPIVNLPQGTVQGIHKVSHDGKTFAAFKGIPYALPPTGDLRFQAPQPPNNWKGVLIANKPYTCIQFNAVPYFRKTTGTEDCLYMNVYVPQKQVDPKDNFEVIVHIHGGAFMFGSPKLFAGPEFIIDGNVIYVTFNYRVGVLGFLSTEDDVVSGNNGLKDQVMALRWIKDNIKHFGGNPESVTLTGLSAGGASVQYHYLSPMSKGLFHRGFSQSGTALSPWALTKNPLNKAKFVANKLGCPVNSTGEMVNCLKSKPDRELVYWTTKLYKVIYTVPLTPFGPVIERGQNRFLTDHPYKILKVGEVYDVPWITSNVSHEGQLYVGYFLIYKILKMVDEQWNELAPYLLELFDTVNDADKTEVVRAIRRHYNGVESFTNQNIHNIIKMFSDRIFLMDAEKAARLQASATKSPVYYNYYHYVQDLVSLLPHFEKVASHADDGQFLFRLVTTPPILSRNDQAMVKKLVDFIVTYAKTSVPRFGNVEWLPLIPNATELNYLDISSPSQVEMKATKALTPHGDFWKSLPIRENDNLY